MKTCSVRFLPDDRVVEVAGGTDLLRAAAMAGIELKSGCGGEGTCGQCAVLVREGDVRVGEGNLSRRRRQQNLVLACRTTLQGDAVVEVPEQSRVTEQRVVLEAGGDAGDAVLAEVETDVGRYEVLPLCRQVPLTLEEPTLTENASDLTRLTAALTRQGDEREARVRLRVLRRLPEALRRGGWRVTATVGDTDGGSEVITVEPGVSGDPPYGVAVDIGTTTVVATLVDMATGATVDRQGTYNRQGRFGEDVISRIIHATERVDGLEELRRAVLDTINGLLRPMLRRNRLKAAQVMAAAIAGNTTMTHLFLGLPPRYIRLEPYIPAATLFPTVRGREAGLSINQEAVVYSLPAVASYVGGDIVAGILATGMDTLTETGLFIDIGTNGEIVLGNQDWLMACACSAGPCFEGGGITCGTRAVPGAIERVRIDPGTFDVETVTVGGQPATGICGSGLVDCLAALLDAGVIDRAGKFLDPDTPRRRDGDEGPEFILVPADESGTGGDIIITQNDVKNLLRAKGAIYAGIRSLLQSVSMDVGDIDRVYIAGGFGNYLNVHDAVRIGLLPDIPRDRFRFVGNTSAKGARLALLSRQARGHAAELARKMTYLELSVGNRFMEEFTSALFLPHTDLSQFPSMG